MPEWLPEDIRSHSFSSEQTVSMDAVNQSQLIVFHVSQYQNSNIVCAVSPSPSNLSQCVCVFQNSAGVQLQSSSSSSDSRLVYCLFINSHVTNCYAL